MIKVECVNVYNYENALRGMRNPLNSWERGDSFQEDLGDMYSIKIGPNDLDLMKRLYSAGPEHRKYLRQIFVSMDITAPLYFWKEMDKYQIGVTTNSCSTMHKIAAKKFELDDFSIEHLVDDTLDVEYTNGKFTDNPVSVYVDLINVLNACRNKYLETKDKKWWWQMIQLLPSSYNQKRTVTMNYENVISIIKQRTNHKLDEWNSFVEILKDLPYIKEITDA